MAIRQPRCSVIQAATGRNSNCPVALLALRHPMTRPRRFTNQRLAIVAPSTLAVTPVDRPSIRPQITQSCHSARICVAANRLTTIRVSAMLTTKRSP